MALIYNLLFTSLLIAATPSSTACPVSCNCTTSDLKVSVSCQGEEITAIPSKLPENTTTVDLKDPVKCDCGFYRYWKLLKGKRIAIQGKCSDLSADLSGSSFKDLTEESFACDGSSISSEKSSRLSAESFTAAVNALPSSSVIAERNPPVASKHIDGEASKSSQGVFVVSSSEAVLLMKSLKAVPAVTSFQAVPVVASSQAVPVVTSSQAVPVVKSTKAVPAVTSFQAVPVVTSSQAVPVVKSSKAVPAVTSFQAVPVVTSSQAVPVVTSSQAVPVVKSTKAVPAVTSLQPDKLSLSPSRSLAKPAVATTTGTPRIREISTSTFVKLAVTSSIRPGSSWSVVTAPPSRSAGVEVKGTSAADVSPTVGGIVNASAAATAPPTMKESPVIVVFDEPETVPLNTMVQVKCIATGNPAPKVHLTFNNQPAENVDGVTVTSSDSETEITFKAVRNSIIYCEATNELGRDKRKIKASVEQTGAKYLLLQVKLTGETFNENLNNKASKEFQNLAERITSQVRPLLSSDPGFLGASVAKFRPGSVKADILIKTYQDNDDSVEKTLKAEISKAKLGTIPVDRYLYTFKQSQACPSVYENVTWNDAADDDSDVQLCPRGAQGFARRNCSMGNWYYTDYTNCKSSEFIRLKNQINQSVSGNNNKDDTDKDILTGLQILLNLTTPNEDYAMLAGDLATSTEILELVVDYTTREKDDNVRTTDEVKLIIKVASNLLHLHNEQQFIVGQKLLQTASKFILALEKYGLQSARVASLGADKSLAIFITENIVMGAGVAYPETISADVIFPNYNWPILENLKEQWNVTTFVVLATQMIKDLQSLAGKDGIRIAGFLYRTLTRILSAESAYSEEGLAFEVNSAVISASMDPKPTGKLNDPVIIATSNLEEVDDDHIPICAFWDFNMNAPHGGWSEEGCNTTNFNTLRTTCQCDHMTNFAVLRRKPFPPVVALSRGSTSDFLHCLYIACWIIIAFAAVTFLILLILCPWLKPDRTWVMHMCVCASIIVTFVLIILGLASYNDLALCNLFSFLVHYFYLCAFSWILTESVYMRIWDTTKGAQKKYWIGYFLLGWGLPGIVLLITWLINKLFMFESFMSCWMSILNPLIWTFFAPAIVFFLVTCIIFVRVWRAITGLPRQALKTYYYNTRFRVRIRYCIILMVMFIITWLVGVLLLTYYTKALLCILFIICCIITGFMLLLFYVIMDRQVRDAFKSCCCYCRRGRRGNYWVAGEKQKPEEEVEEPEYEYRQRQEREQERQRLVSEGVEQQEQDPDIEMNGVEFEEPLLREEPRPVLMYEGTRPLDSSTESFDPLYDRVRPSQSVTVEVQPGLPTEDEGPKPEPVYAQVIKPKRLRHPESDSDDDDDLLTPEEREARGIRGLTREQVIRMAKKSDASKKVLKTYDSPSGSKELLGGPVYLLNQQELDEELKQFRSFFAHGKTPPSSEPTTSTPKPEAGSSTPSGTFKRETSTEVHQSYHRVESTSSSLSKRTFSEESQKSVTSVTSWKEETKVEKKVVSPARLVEETAIDSSLQELDRTDDSEDDSPSKPTAV